MLSDKAFASIFTFTRASKAWDFDATGTLTEYAAATIRNGYDPATLLESGWMLEGGAINLVPNPAAVGGAVAGNFPTFWAVGGVNAGLTVTWPGQVLINGFTCQLVRFQGVMSAAASLGNIQLGTSLAVTAAAGANWSLYASVYAGSLTGITGHNLRISTASTPLVATTVDGTLSRKSAIFAFATDTTAAPQLVPTGSNGAAIDITYALACPQLTAGSFLYSPIFPNTPGTTGASTLAPDALTVSGASFLNTFAAGAPQGFVIAETQMDTLVAVTGGRNVVQLSDGTINNRVEFRTSTAGTAWNAISVIGGVQQGTNATSPTNPQYGVVQRVGLRWTPAGLAVCCNGSALGTLAAALPAVSVVTIGARADGILPLNGRVRAVWMGAHAPTDAKFIAACSPGAVVDTQLK